MRRTSIITALTLGAAIALAGCGGKQAAGPPPTPPGARVVSMPNGLSYVDLTVGAGAEAKTGQTATVNYTGWLETGKKFDSSVGSEPFSFTLGAGEVIPGWDQGVPGMKVGGKRKLTVPYQLAYGEDGMGPIPPKASLVFEIELLDVK